MASVPPVAQVSPLRIGRFDQLDLFFSTPGFHFFLAADGGHDVTMAFEIYEAGHVVFCSEPFERVSFVLEDSMLDVAGHSDVEDAALAGENIDVVDPGHFLIMLALGGCGRDVCHKAKITVPERNFKNLMSS